VSASDDRCSEQSSLRFFAIPGTTYHIAVGGSANEQGSIELRVRFLVPPPNDDFANATQLDSRLGVSASGTNNDATVEPREPRHAGEPTLASVWYRWTAPASRLVKMKSCRSDFDTLIGVYSGEDVDSLRSIASDDDSCRAPRGRGRGRGSIVRFRAVADTTYHIAVAGFFSAQGSIQLRLVASKRDTSRSGE